MCYLTKLVDNILKHHYNSHILLNNAKRKGKYMKYQSTIIARQALNNTGYPTKRIYSDKRKNGHRTKIWAPYKKEVAENIIAEIKRLGGTATLHPNPNYYGPQSYSVIVKA